MTGAVFIDLRKAFDTMEHKVLLSKLPLKGIVDRELDWITNYLSDRYQYVHYDGVKSDLELVKYGIPQGSILGPLLFLVQINDLVKSIKHCNIQMYADDTVIYTSNSNISVIEQTLTSEMKNVSKWLDKNRLIINLKKGKTESLLFGTAKRLSSKDPLQVYMNEQLINVADGYKYLGVWLEPTLNMSEHLRKVLGKANARLKLLSHVRDSLSVFAAKAVYNSFILPTMLYCSTPVVKVSDTMSKRFENLQNRAQKIIYGTQENNTCKVISINNQKKMKVVIQMFKCRQGTCIPALRTYADKINHRHNTRNNKSLLRLPLVKTETAKRSLYFQGPYCFNELPRDIRSQTSIVIFKSKLKKYFLQS